jgi:predicted PurR-regulated permease PerM
MSRRETEATNDRVASDREYAPTPVQTDGNGSAIAAFVLGFMSLTFFFLVFTGPAALLFGLIAAIFGFVGIGKAKSLGGLHKGLAVSGLIMGVLALLLGIAALIGGLSLASNPQFQQQFQELLDNAQNAAS